MGIDDLIGQRRAERHSEYVAGLNGINGTLSPEEFSYFVSISISRGYVYVETPKVACSSIKRFLISAELDEKVCFRHFEYVHFRDFSPLLNPKQVNSFRAFVARSPFTFCFVRNPYERLLSAYLDKIARDGPRRSERLRALSLPHESGSQVSFSDFVRAVSRQPDERMDPHWRPQCLQTCQGLIQYDLVGRFERLESDLQLVAKHIGVDFDTYYESELRHATGTSELLESYYEPLLRDLVYQRFERDFTTFDYQR